MNHKYDCFKGFKGTIPLPAGKKKKKGITGPAENTIQEWAEGYCNQLGIKWLHLPNEIYLVFFGRKFKIPAWFSKVVSEYITGVPDHILWKPMGKYNSSLIMEYKRKNGRFRQSQRQWQRMNNVNVILVDSKEQAKAVIDEWRNDK